MLFKTLCIDIILSIPDKKLLTFHDIVELREKLMKLKLSDNYKGFGGHVRLEISESLFQKIQDIVSEPK